MKSQLRKHLWFSRMVFALSLGLLFPTTGCVNPLTSATSSASSSASVAITPSAATVPEGGSLPFLATVKGVANTTVTWSVQGGATGGSITSSGVYTAPNALGTYTVVATSVADPTTSAAAVVTIELPTSTAAGSSGCAPISVPLLPTMAPDAIAVASDPSGKYGKFAYVVNRYANCVSMYAIDIATGALISTGSIATVSSPSYVAVDPLGRFAYVANNDGVAMYTIDAATGALSSTGTIAAVPGGSVTVDPSSKFAYVANDDVAMYTINASTGALASIGTINAGAGLFSLAIAIDPSGRFVYVARPGDSVGVAIGYVSMYMIDPTSGALTSTGSIAAGIDPFSVAVDPSSRFAYVANLESGDISMYSINGITGALTSIGTVTTAFAPIAVAVHPSGKFLYAANNTTSNVSIYAIDDLTGVLTSVGTVAAGSSPSSIVIDPSGKFVYVTNFDSDNVSMYSIDIATGSLTLIGTIGT